MRGVFVEAGMDAVGSTAIAAALAAKDKKRARRSAAERRRIVEETLVPGASVARVARSHGINANQVFAWRRLHLAGKLVDARKTSVIIPRLLPVTVSDGVRTAVSEVDAEKAATLASYESHVASGSIHLQFEKAHLRVNGNADPAVLRVILECLLG